MPPVYKPVAPLGLKTDASTCRRSIDMYAPLGLKADASTCRLSINMSPLWG